jgi:REP element-mobilizing transposase RayT
MTTARSLLVDPDSAGFYHCVSRCVRRSWLCGVDPYSGISYEHRRAWVEQRLLELAEIFAVGVYAYAVMSNPVHVVLRIDPTAAASWTDEDVAMRWVRLFPAKTNGETDEAGCRLKEQNLLGNADRLRDCRQRLGSVAWFMKSLNEPIARRANGEDACTGRFWEGRYQCQALLDDAAVLTCMSYVDLNPIRAGMAETLESSAHTSAVQRIETLRSDPASAKAPLSSLNVIVTTPCLPITTEDSLDLLDWTGRLTRADKHGSIGASEPPILRTLGLSEQQWHQQIIGTETCYWRAIGSARTLIEKAAAIEPRPSAPRTTRTCRRRCGQPRPRGSRHAGPARHRTAAGARLGAERNCGRRSRAGQFITRGAQSSQRELARIMC